uniref:uncharacterized protein LOC132686088 n=1 Tax=Panthera onca TaxID=9690 RepID=UPI002952A686|nr:uncharacterized protein LOC132686088 [Panthera onca]
MGFKMACCPQDTGGLWQRRLVSEHPAEGVMTVRDPGRDLCPAAAVQEGPSGIRDVSGIGFRRRGRATRRRYRNEAGQFISMVTFFEAQGATSGAQDARGQGTCRRGRPPRKYRKRKVAITAEVTLFEMVALGKNSVQTAVEEWVQSYKEDRELALLDLISFFVQCCGCEGMVTAELYQTNQGNSVVHKMTEKFDQETGLYYKKFLAYPWILTIMWPEKLADPEHTCPQPSTRAIVSARGTRKRSPVLRAKWPPQPPHRPPGPHLGCADVTALRRYVTRGATSAVWSSVSTWLIPGDAGTTGLALNPWGLWGDHKVGAAPTMGLQAGSSRASMPVSPGLTGSRPGVLRGHLERRGEGGYVGRTCGGLALTLASCAVLCARWVRGVTHRERVQSCVHIESGSV